MRNCSPLQFCSHSGKCYEIFLCVVLYFVAAIGPIAPSQKCHVGWTSILAALRKGSQPFRQGAGRVEGVEHLEDVHVVRRDTCSLKQVFFHVCVHYFFL